MTCVLCSCHCQCKLCKGECGAARPGDCGSQACFFSFLSLHLPPVHERALGRLPPPPSPAFPSLYLSDIQNMAREQSADCLGPVFRERVRPGEMVWGSSTGPPKGTLGLCGFSEGPLQPLLLPGCLSHPGLMGQAGGGWRRPLPFRESCWGHGVQP